jgi:metal-responsive CopG/Arc/MetJ family transcriptional regulator
MTGYTFAMKTAISIPDDLYRQVEACARRLKVSRSHFFATAARQYLARQATPARATEAWNRVILAAGQPGDEPGAIALRQRTKAIVRAASAKRR